MIPFHVACLPKFFFVCFLFFLSPPQLFSHSSRWWTTHSQNIPWGPTWQKNTQRTVKNSLRTRKILQRNTEKSGQWTNGTWQVCSPIPPKHKSSSIPSSFLTFFLLLFLTIHIILVELENRTAAAAASVVNRDSMWIHHQSLYLVLAWSL